ncbi:alpha/beta hydrolase family protein [Paenibacillus faecalis]|uniref:S9 family peptidase n=1 Tax=Paenibacillus faecalis TaxID=2079532 RepID=UPI000D0F1A12|nr:S9 family peptidase [Paenibacillus faecalis]
MSEQRVITAEDLHRMHWISDPVVSRQSGAICYISRTVSDKHDGYHSHIRMMDANGVRDIPFTAGEQDTAPAWSPDGSQIAFLRKQEHTRQVWLISAGGGEARVITNMEYGVSAFQWSPDGKALLFKTETDIDKKHEPHSEKNNHSEMPEATIVDRIKFKSDGVGLWNGRRSHLFLLDLLTKECIQLTSGAFDVASFAWSADSCKIAYTATKPSAECPDPDLRFSNDLFVVDREGKESKQMTDGNLSINSISYTPDGQFILMLADNRSHGFATLTKIYLIPANGGTYRALYEDLDHQLGYSCVSDMRSGGVRAPLFSQDGRYVYLQVTRNGSVHIGRFALNGSEHQIILRGEREIYQFDLAPDDNIIFAAADSLQPGDLFSYNRTNGEEKRLTHCNEELWAELSLSEPEMFTFNTSDDWPIQGWIMKPIDFKEGSKVPAILEIHGGPQLMYGHTFMHEFQLLAAAGYAVFYINPRGSQGYGQTHVNTVRGDYGGRDYQDLMEAVDYVIKTFPYIDETRIGVTGGSYGGFMTNWIVGHTKRFKAAVTQRSISNWISFHGVSDIGYLFTHDQIWGNPWDDLEKLWKHSPIAYVKNVQTPLLILHGEQDLRCPIEQAEQLFVALKQLGKVTRLVRFPDADHNLSRSGHPYLRISRLKHIIGWFEEHMEV